MKHKTKFPVLVSLFMIIFLSVNADAGTYSMFSLFSDIPQVIRSSGVDDMPPPVYLATIAGSGSSDNETESASFGTLSMDVEGRSFDNETGTYRSSGAIFTGLWTASEYDSEATRYWGETININYSFFFVGMFLFDDSMVIGSFFTSAGSTLTSEPSDPVSGFSLFLGILVSDS